MKVKVKTGNQAGQVLDLPRIEAENMMATGYADPFVEPVVVKKAAVEKPPEVDRSKRR